ncbi:ABC transporter permease subunit [Thiohalobacter sp. IOR34]|uniref:ABC transporter permease subunit n=1 Tax=Thiohalobacter sp. IOR34 TaxID=3057176 RepID=UPI0025B18FBC|nr:ABC transporter permease subunit [Thiohalobacter sp. IOR34]WJW75068.1 ABC transporter permease subunit [Thiohalobacter sp. IOR34]
MNSPPDKSGSILERIPEATRLRRRRLRRLKDVLARRSVSLGGMSVIIAITLIFFYLLYVVVPLLRPATAEPLASYPVPGSERPTLLLAMEEQAEIGVRFSADGEVDFLRLADGQLLSSQRLPLPPGVAVTSFAVAEPSTRTLAYGLADGRALVVRHDYRVTFPNDRRLITPELQYPLGETPLVVDPQGQPLQRLAVQVGEEGTTLVAVTADGRTVLSNLRQEESFLGEEMELVEAHSEIPATIGRSDYLLLDPEQSQLYLARRSGELARFDLSDKEAPRLLEQLPVVEGGEQLTALRLLAGGISLLVGTSSGRIDQWFTVRDAQNQERLQRIRSFAGSGAAVLNLTPEYARKGFLAGDAEGRVTAYHTTAHNTLFSVPLAKGALRQLAIAPRADALLAEDGTGRLQLWRVDNEYPEVSWSSLWGKVWYESYPEPAYIWQSSSASNDFEPKLSLTPLAFGTFKAAFYAMLIGAPLAILGAIYTAYFMAPRMRSKVKPTIEIMEALPTVILGFLAGLWLAPLIENYLPGIFALLLVMPLGVLLFGFLWSRLPDRLRHRIPAGWEALPMIPVVALLGWASFALSHPLELLLFDGDMRMWLKSIGIDFDQRNSIVVGLAMGFAVIPTIFSIAEDAIFNVPKHLTSGSLALGATPWQTLTRVVILTASPGIFSAMMIGLGRAVGETMIVLMATGNTPVMDMSIFQGMRTLSANIAVELPEAEVASTHFRVLFLAALVLFLFTFLFNTLAELVRQRLRGKYASL